MRPQLQEKWRVQQQGLGAALSELAKDVHGGTCDACKRGKDVLDVLTPGLAACAASAVVTANVPLVAVCGGATMVTSFASSMLDGDDVHQQCRPSEDDIKEIYGHGRRAV